MIKVEGRERMFLGKTYSRTWRITIFLAAFAIVAYFIIGFRDWQADFTTLFLRTGRWEMIIFLSLVGFVAITVLIKLLQWLFRMEVQ